MASRTLAIVLAGSSTGARKALDKVDERLGRFGGAIKTAAKAAGIAGIAIGAAFTAIGVAASKSLSKFDDIGKASARIGITTDAVQKLGFAAEQSGANFDTVERGLTRMAASLDDARLSENSPAARALAAMNLGIEQFDGLDPEQQLELFADALAGVEDPSKRAAYAQDVFGRSGAQLLPLLQNGSAGIRSLGKEFEATGGLIDGKAIKSGERFNDTMNIIKKTVVALRDQFVAALLPTLQRMADVFREKVVPILRDVVIPILIKLGEISLTVFEFMLRKIEEAVGAAINIINGFIDGINFVISGLNKVPGVSIDAVEKLDDLNFSFGTAKIGAEELDGAVGGVETAIDNEAGAAQDAVTPNDNYGASLKRVRSDALAAGAAIEGLYTAQQMLNLAMDGFSDVASAAALAARPKIDYGSSSGGSGGGSRGSGGGGGGSSRGSGSGGASGDSGSNGGGSSADADEGFLTEDQLGYATHKETGERFVKELTSSGDVQYRRVGVRQRRGDELLETEDDGVDMLEMAKGGIVRRPTVALIGEAGPEAVVPLDRMQPTTVNYVFNINAQDGLIDVQSLREQLTEWVNVDFARGAYSM